MAVTTPGPPESLKTNSRVTLLAVVVALGGIALGAGIWQMLHAKRSAPARQSATQINLSVDPIGVDAAAKQVQLFEQQHPDIRVNIVTVPSASDGRHDLFVKQLSSKSPALDVFWGDVTWAGEFISKGWVLPLTRALTDADQAAYWKGPMDGCRGPDGAIYCIPSYVDAGLLYYRKDLLDESGLKPPKTWDDLVRISTTVSAKHKDMSGIVFQAEQYEGLTSGSTGTPKGVINTHRMICSNQQAILQTLPFLGDAPPVLVDWLPWHHTFGGNHNVGIVVYNGGSLYLDEGRPMPGGFDESVRNLREVAPTVYLNVPKGYEELVRAFRDDPALASKFFDRVQVLFYAAAGLSQHVADELQEIAVENCGERLVLVTGLGSTETAPMAICRPWASELTSAIGLPVPGVEAKLVPWGAKLEIRVRGPNVTPGYWRQDALTREAFDDEGFYCMGDAARPVDPRDLSKGLVFDGRIKEDFKLSTGTWVSVGPLRAKILAHFAPYVRDAVIAGHDRDEVGMLVVPDVDACRTPVPIFRRQRRRQPSSPIPEYGVAFARGWRPSRQSPPVVRRDLAGPSCSKSRRRSTPVKSPTRDRSINARSSTGAMRSWTISMPTNRRRTSSEENEPAHEC